MPVANKMRITEDMVDAGIKAYAHWLTDKKALRRDMVQEIYRAMTNAKWKHMEDVEESTSKWYWAKN